MCQLKNQQRQDRLPWNSYSDSQKLATLLGTLPHTLQVKTHQRWIKTMLPSCHATAALITRVLEKEIQVLAASTGMTTSELQNTFSQPAAPGGPPVRPLSPIIPSSEDES